MGDKASIKRFKLTTFKLRSLLNITQAINENLTQEELLSRYESILKEDLSIGKLILYKLEDDWKCILSSGVTDEKAESINVEEDLLPYEEISFVSSPQSS
jgi:sigma-B regulation protein RsbU (phosphoserine phosphatase)